MGVLSNTFKYNYRVCTATRWELFACKDSDAFVHEFRILLLRLALVYLQVYCTPSCWVNTATLQPRHCSCVSTVTIWCVRVHCAQVRRYLCASTTEHVYSCDNIEHAWLRIRYVRYVEEHDSWTIASRDDVHSIRIFVSADRGVWRRAVLQRCRDKRKPIELRLCLT